MLIIYIIIFIVSCFLLFKSGAWTVKSLSRIAAFLGFSEFFVAFILMAVATSLPELFIGISSAVSRKPSLCLGNVLGANIINLTLVIFAVLLVLKKLPFKKEIVRHDLLAASIIGLAALILMADGWLSRPDGFILLLMFFAFLIDLYKKQQASKKFDSGNHKHNLLAKVKSFFKNFLFFVLSVSLLLVSAYGVTYTASEIARVLSIPLVLIGIVIVALGTTLPEMIFSLRVSKLKKSEMILGNVLGSVVVNSTLVLGLAALIWPIQILAPRSIMISAIFFVLTLIFFGIFSRTHFAISRREGIILLLIYLGFLVVQIIFA